MSEYEEGASHLTMSISSIPSILAQHPHVRSILRRNWEVTRVPTIAVR
jgi:hypothetical protein